MTRPEEPSGDRRVPFFLIAAVACFALYFPTPPDFRWVPLSVGIVYTVLAALTALDQLSRRSRSRD